MLRALCIWVALALGDVHAAFANSEQSEALTAPIAAQPLAQALEAFAQQTGLHVVYVSGVVRNQKSQAVPAGLGAKEALARLLEGTVATGYTDTGDVIRALPQMITTGFDSSRYGVAGWGTATADLRGLGPQRTVVLVNGKRLGLGDPNTGNLNAAPDLDQVPLPMIERVDVLTGGASATYGSDAVAGVVNFILKDHVQGVQIDAQYGLAQHAQDNYYLQSVEAANGFAHPTGTTIDGFTRDVSVLAGTGFHDGEGQVTPSCRGHRHYCAQHVPDLRHCGAGSLRGAAGDVLNHRRASVRPGDRPKV